MISDEMVLARLRGQPCSIMGNFRELIVWRRAQDLALAEYGSTSSFREEECYGLTAQMRRAAASVSSNIAEGCGRQGDREPRKTGNVAKTRPLNRF
jgi:23S rRNA-intervening sequence protein